MSQEIEDLKERVKALEESPLMSIANKLFPAGSPMEEEILSSLDRLAGASLDDLVEESKTLFDAGPTLPSDLDLKIAEFVGADKPAK